MNIINKFTLQTLIKNRTRTIVTIIGIILSAAMFTAVTTFGSSLLIFIQNFSINANGKWHAFYYDMTESQYKSLTENSQISNSFSLQNIGYAKIDTFENEHKPYLFIGGADKKFFDNMPVKLTSGRLPEKENEIIIPEHLYENGGVKLSINDVLTLEVGDRFLNETKLNQSSSLFTEEDSEKEELRISGIKTYTVVGFYSRPSFEQYSAPGYTALTVATLNSSLTSDVYFEISNPNEIFDFLENNYTDLQAKTNSDYLTSLGVNRNDNFQPVLYSLLSILIGIIMLGSISLIYNSFSISVNERTRQFGLLSSIGATKRQLRKSVLFEGVVICLIGIPLGLLSGIFGMSITFSLLRNTLSLITYGIQDVALEYHASWQALVIASIVCFVTVMISAYIPSKRAIKVTAIEAIRQSKDIKLKGKKLKTSRLTYWLFGLEGLLASKNFKRNKKKYRATVISLFISVVLFISTYSFCYYVTNGVSSVFQYDNYDIAYIYFPTQGNNDSSPDSVYEKLSSVEGVTTSGYVNSSSITVDISSDNLSESYLEILKNDDFSYMTNGNIVTLPASIEFLDDKSYEEFLKNNSLDTSIYMNTENPVALIYDEITLEYNDKYYNFNVFKNNLIDIETQVAKNIDGYKFSSIVTDSNGEESYQYIDENMNTKLIQKNEAVNKISLKTGEIIDTLPDFIIAGYTVTLIYPYSAIDGYFKDILDYQLRQNPTIIKFNTNDYRAVYKNMTELSSTIGLNKTYFENHAQMVESNNAYITIVYVFTYGFIILISLISVANVFNTISTNISLRRCEFAILKSIGMTKRGFNKMMNFECLLYGIKGLIYGIPVAVLVTYLIYRSIMQGIVMSFVMPWESIAISVLSVFAVVFTTMVYAMNKIKKDNPIDAIKNENL